MLFDWIVVRHIIGVNPAYAVRGPKHVETKGRTPVLECDEARALLNSMGYDYITGLRDRALIGTMIYTFARIGAVLQMNVGDYYSQGRRGWIRLHVRFFIVILIQQLLLHESNVVFRTCWSFRFAT